jgi:hypothetical protein
MRSLSIAELDFVAYDLLFGLILGTGYSTPDPVKSKPVKLKLVRMLRFNEK